MNGFSTDRARRVAAVALALLVAAPALAQGGGAAGSGGSSGSEGGRGASSSASAPYWAAVNANNVFVRSSPSVQSSYPFGRLSAGDVVEVLEETYGWARVRCAGPAFAGIQGYVPADRRVELSADGSTLTVTAKSEVKAANIGSKGSPDASWKPIAKLAAGDTLAVLGTMEGEREKVFLVALPASAEGFINMNYLRRASSAEVEAAKAPRSAGAAPVMAAASGAKPVAPKGSAAGAAPAHANAAPKHAATAESAKAGAAPEAAGDGGMSIEVDETTITEKPDGTVKVTERDEVITQPRRAVEPPPTPAMTETAANRAEYADLESIWDTVKLEPLEDAEIGALRGRYAELMTRPNVAGDIRQMAKARVEQLTLKLEVQERMHTLERLRLQRGQDLDRIKALAIAMQARSDYDAVGVLNASTVFDGRRLPALYRLQDPAVGQVVAYVVPQDDFQLATMLGVLVGIRGQKHYDEALRVNLIEPRSVDILTQRRDPQVTTPGGTTASGASPSTGADSMSGSAPAPTPTPSPTAVEYAPVPPDAP